MHGWNPIGHSFRFLGEALGPDYEVVLHDLTSEEGTMQPS